MGLKSEIKINEDVFASIVELAVDELGIAKVNKDTIKSKLTKTSNTKVVNTKEGSVSIDISISCKYGDDLLSISKKIQENIKTNIETMTSTTVDSINILVSGIYS